jgi:hypothetical protein
MKHLDGWDVIRAYRIIFFGYAVLGMIKFGLAAALSHRVEAEKELPAHSEVDGEQAPLLANGDEQPKPKKSMLPSISSESRIIVLNLCLLFALDSLASGLVSL